MLDLPPPKSAKRSPQPQRLPNQRWEICPAQAAKAEEIAQATGLSPLLAQVLINRGIETPAQAQAFLEPESQGLPSPLEEFPDLALSLELLQEAIAQQHKIAICGDYDADGMTSTALLLRALRFLGAQVDYAIPSRMQEGYGINQRIVEEFHQEGVRLILTVDNGIAAKEPIARAKELGVAVIITDHHDLPPELPPADAILNPKLIAESSPYRGLAGVGVAYVLAVCLAKQLGKGQELVELLLELFTLGTIADLAPLTGVNRRWVKRGLRLLPQSKLTGVQALIQMSGVQGSGTKALKPEAIGFRLGPRINAVGRIADPQIVIELLTTDDWGIALERAMQCEQINQQRQQLCEQIEQAAIAWCEQSQLDLQRERVLVVVQPDWHHGVIGIVASRLVERYGVPVFIGSYEEEDGTTIRGSARGIPEFDVFGALQFAADLLERFGGHRAAGGFSLRAENLSALRSRLSEFACQQLQPEHLKPLISIDAQASLDEIDLSLYEQIDALHPCGIENRDPVFWTAHLQVLDQQLVGKGHLKLTLRNPQLSQARPAVMKAIAWRWGEYYPLPEYIDVAYRLRSNHWNGNTTIELELVGVRQAVAPAVAQVPSKRSLTLVKPEAPPVATHPEWLTLTSLSEFLAQDQGTVLLYGSARPQIPPSMTPSKIEYDRPRCCCDVLVLWTLPPSQTHLNWLLALGKPRRVYLYSQIPPLLEAHELLSRLQAYLQEFPDQPLNLLQLGQQWWVAPCTIVAGLRELGYPCEDFPATYSVGRELERLIRWYTRSANQFAHS